MNARRELALVEKTVKWIRTLGLTISVGTYGALDGEPRVTVRFADGTVERGLGDETTASCR